MGADVVYCEVRLVVDGGVGIFVAIDVVTECAAKAPTFEVHATTC
jgi:hypothetical protein